MEDQNFKIVLDRLAKNVKAMRIHAGLSQEGLALAADVDRTYVSQLERGIANPSLAILHRIAGVLGCSLEICFLDSAGRKLPDELEAARSYKQP